MPLARLTWRDTRSRIRADRRRIESVLAELGGRAPLCVLLHPSFACAFLFRISNHLYRAGHRYAARFVWHVNVLVTGADISEPADIGEGLVVVTPPGTAIMCTAGRNLTVMPCAGVGGEIGRREDVGAGPGLPVLEDDVILEPHSGVLGPVRIGHRVRIPAGIAMTQDVPADTEVRGPSPRFVRRRDLT